MEYGPVVSNFEPFGDAIGSGEWLRGLVYGEVAVWEGGTLGLGALITGPLKAIGKKAALKEALRDGAEVSVEQGAKKSGRLGNEATRAHVDQVATEMEARGWTITHGGGRGPEEYLPGPGGARRGSSYPDITAIKNGKTLRVNTVDTRADGVTLTTREAANAARIRAQTGEHVLTIPKPKSTP